MHLFDSVTSPRIRVLPSQAHDAAQRAASAGARDDGFTPDVDDRMIEVYERARNPHDPFELRNLWLGRIEHELGEHAHRPWLAEQWRSTRVRRCMRPEEVLSSRSTVRFVKELFNWFFRDDLYGDLPAADPVILSGGAVDEQEWGLPNVLKDCLRFALDQDWYGYSDSRGRSSARDAVADYESGRIDGPGYTGDNVALTMGGTVAINSLADFLLHGLSDSSSPVLCGIPNYPPLVETIARRANVRLVPLPSENGRTSLAPLIAALSPDTPMVMLQTAANPTGAMIDEADLAALTRACSPSTTIVLDECHEWLGPRHRAGRARSASNVVRVSSLSKTWSAPGLKVGWLLADSRFIADYYEYASTAFGGPPSFFYTLVEVLARMERWLDEGLTSPGPDAVSEFESSYGITAPELGAAYRAYRAERLARDSGLTTMREATTTRLSEMGGLVVPPAYSINTAVRFPGWDDSYRCFRDLLRDTGVSVFPGILTFCLSGGVVRVTTARRWEELDAGLRRLETSVSWPSSLPEPVSRPA
jgi:aspartate/methionine/tyrosine aminotransferase